MTMGLHRHISGSYESSKEEKKGHDKKGLWFRAVQGLMVGLIGAGVFILIGVVAKRYKRNNAEQQECEPKDDAPDVPDNGATNSANDADINDD